MGASPVARRRNNEPLAWLHEANRQALVRDGNRNIYLGPHGSPQVLERYGRLVRDWRAERDRAVASAEAKVDVKTAGALATRTRASCGQKYEVAELAGPVLWPKANAAKGESGRKKRRGR